MSEKRLFYGKECLNHTNAIKPHNFELFISLKSKFYDKWKSDIKRTNTTASAVVFCFAYT